jgi:hypothetical protein
VVVIEIWERKKSEVRDRVIGKKPYNRLCRERKKNKRNVEKSGNDKRDRNVNKTRQGRLIVAVRLV